MDHDKRCILVNERFENHTLQGNAITIIQDFVGTTDAIVFERYVIDRDLFELAKVRVNEQTVW